MLLGRCSADLLSLNILYNKDKFLKCGNVPIPPRERGKHSQEQKDALRSVF
jgi:hypothetical protein